MLQVCTEEVAFRLIGKIDEEAADVLKCWWCVLAFLGFISGDFVSVDGTFAVTFSGGIPRVDQLCISAWRRVADSRVLSLEKSVMGRE